VGSVRQFSYASARPLDERRGCLLASLPRPKEVQHDACATRDVGRCSKGTSSCKIHRITWTNERHPIREGRGLKKKRSTSSASRLHLRLWRAACITQNCCLHSLVASTPLLLHEGVFPHLLEGSVAVVVADDGLAPLPHLLAENLRRGGGVSLIQVRYAMCGDEDHLGGGGGGGG